MADIDATTIRSHGDAAMAAIRQLDHDDIDLVKQQLNVALMQLIAMRDALIAARRAGGPCDEWLSRTNAIISVLFGTEYPLAGLKQQRVTETREALERLLAEKAVH